MKRLLFTSALLIIIVAFSLEVVSLLRPAVSLPLYTLAEFHPKSSSLPLTFLPGPLNLNLGRQVVLGWDTEPITEADIVKYVNIERLKINSPALTVNPKLTEAATLRVGTIFKHQNFSHYDPYDHIQLDTVLPRVKYLFSYASENIGLAQDTAPGIVSGFMSSPPHRQNLLDPNLKETGVGIEKGMFGGNYVVIVSQIFASPVSQDTYLGYSQSDLATVRSLVGGIDSELTRTQNLLAANPGSQYYTDWLKLLTAQKDRLNQVYDRMLSGEPFQQVHYDLIASYNSAWKTAPTG